MKRDLLILNIVTAVLVALGCACGWYCREWSIAALAGFLGGYALAVNHRTAENQK